VVRRILALSEDDCKRPGRHALGRIESADALAPIPEADLEPADAARPASALTLSETAP